MEEIEPAGFSGRVKTTKAGARSESWFCAPVLCEGTAGVDCEWESGCATQQPAMPQWPLQVALCAICFWQTGTAEAEVDASGIHTNNVLNRMAISPFTAFSVADAPPIANHFCGASFFCASSASLIFFMYLAGSLLNCGMQPPQQNLTSCP